MDVSYNLHGYLEVVLGGDSVYLNLSSIAQHLDLFSPNQRKTIIAETKKLIEAYDVGNCPTMLRLLLVRLVEEA